MYHLTIHMSILPTFLLKNPHVCSSDYHTPLQRVDISGFGYCRQYPSLHPSLMALHPRELHERTTCRISRSAHVINYYKIGSAQNVHLMSINRTRERARIRPSRIRDTPTTRVKNQPPF